MVEWILEPLQYGFFQRGILAGLMTALACGALSAFIVWRGMAFIGDALTHSVLPGIVVAYVLGISLLWGALGAALAAVALIALITGKNRLKEDTAIGVIFTGTFALGILMLNRITTAVDLMHILFGNILGVSRGDLFIVLGITLPVLLAVVLFFKELLVTSFDPTHATAIGLSPNIIRYGLLVLIAITTVLATKTVGVVLVLALLVTPAATASLLVKKLPVVITISIALSLMAVLCGFYLSHYLDLAPGSVIVVVLTVFFGLSFIYSRIRKLSAGKGQT